VRHLPKHLRPRYRYLAVEVEAWPNAELDRRGFQATLWAAARSFLGDADSAALDLRVVAADFWTGGGAVIVRVRRGTVEQARAALACLDAVDGEPVRVGVRGVGGTIRATKSKYLGGPPETCTTEQVDFRGESGEAWLRKDRTDVRIDGQFVGATPEEL